MSDIVIVSAARTPIGKLNGSLHSLPGHELGAIAIRAALQRAKIEPREVSDVILGQVLTAGAGQNPARQTAMAAGIPHEATAMGVNQVCGSGLRAVVAGWQGLLSGEGEIVVVGGQESMSQAPHAAHLRAGKKLGDMNFQDTLIRDGLWDAFGDYHMGITAENIAKRFGISRTDQDEFAFHSQRKAAAAQAEGRFSEEIVPVRIPGRKGDVIVEQDEDIRGDTTREGLAKLRTPFVENGTVTAGNASGINDGAAALVLMRAEKAVERGLKPLGRLVSWATVGIDPAIMGMGPVPATQSALAKAGWKLDDVDLIEANEAFAVQACAVGLELRWNPEKVNVNGGAIALGHPIGASGARIMVTLLHELRRRDAKRGLATLCIGGGMGIALCVERA